ncbi:hypothetical protein HPP92_010900 [Vanilla planifolia]|uniref:BRCA1-associated protein n=1 Tax=Vanilla planifolia TaxID=51239 RepID=A0A835R633_VANPL|nr:hypothetical protein HPP92_010900 [Vanilla planifolia]
MFSLRIYSLESPCLDLDSAGATYADHLSPESAVDKEYQATSSRRNPKTTPRIQVLRGIIHLFRRATPISSPSDPTSSSFPPPSSSDAILPAGRGTLLLVLAVPFRLSPEDFLHFCGSYAEGASGLHVIRNDGLEDRFSVLVKFDDQKSADAFYLNLNGWRFSSSEGEVCHILFLASVEFMESIEIAGTPPLWSNELPTCPVCIERLDQEITGIMSTTCDHSFQCSCISKWSNSSCSVCLFCQEHSAKPSCSVCGTQENLWICVICGFVGCGRYKEGHAFRHWKATQHCFSLDLETQRVWDYVGDNYVHRLNQSEGEDKLLKTKSECTFTGDHCESYTFSENSGLNGALLTSKVEAIVDEYNRLLSSQLESQREYYETLLKDAKDKRERYIAEAVDRAVESKLQEIQFELERISKEKKTITDVNENLMQKQKLWQDKIKEIEHRESETLKLKDLKIHELEEEIRDFTVYIEAQKAVDVQGAAVDIRGGTLLPVPSPTVSSSRAKRPSRITRKRS